jgi:outer membrane protein assembly factor BamB
LLLVLAFSALLAAGASGQKPLKLEWASNVTDLTGGLYESVLGGLNFEDVDGDGTVDVLICRRKGSGDMSDRIVCISGKDGSLQWIYPPPDQSDLPGDPMCIPAIGDLEGDGKLEIVAIGRGAWVHCIDGNGAKKWEFTPKDGSDNSATLVDVDDDGTLEVIFATGGEGWIYCLNHDGTERWSYQMQDGTNSAPAAWDVNRDGDVEVIVPCKDGQLIYCLSNTGTEIWRFDTGDQPGQTVPAIADIDQDDEYEIVVLVPDELRVYCLNFWGGEKWRFDGFDPAAAQLYVAPYQGVTLADIDGDGFIETFVSELGMGAAGPEPRLFCLTHDGNVKWVAPLIGFSILVGDFTGDGNMNVVGGRGFWQVGVLDANGNVEYWWDHMAYDPNIPIDDAFGAPLWGPGDTTQAMGDIDGDGLTEWIFESDPYDMVWCFTADGAYDPAKMIWTRGNGNAANVPVIPIPEGVALLVSVGLFAAWTGTKR